MTTEQLKKANDLSTRIDQYSRLCIMLKGEKFRGTTIIRELEEDNDYGHNGIGDPIYFDETMRKALYQTAYDMLSKVQMEFSNFLNPPIHA